MVLGRKECRSAPRAAGQDYLRVLVTGAAGSGTSTLGRALAARLGGVHLEADDYFWLPTPVPFTERLDADERLALILKALTAADRAVVSGSVYGWGPALEDSFSLIVFLTAPTAVRVERLRTCELERWGRVDRMFLEWAEQYDEGRLPGRSLSKHVEWMARRNCPTVHIDGEVTVVHAMEKALAASNG